MLTEVTQSISANTGSFTKWFALVYDRLRALLPSSSEATWARDDVAAVGQLLCSLQTMPAQRRRDLSDQLAQCAAMAESAPAKNAGHSATLSLVDVMDLLEQYGETYDDATTAATGGSSTNSLSLQAQWRAHVVEDSTGADLRLMLSLLALTDADLVVLRARLPVVFSPPSSPRATSPTTNLRGDGNPPFSTYVPESSPITKRMRPVDDPESPRHLSSHSSPPLALVSSGRCDPSIGSERRTDVGVAPIVRPKQTPTAPGCSPATVSAMTLDGLLWRPPATRSAVCDKIVNAGAVASSVGDDAPPGRPFDPEHPQRVMESTPEKLVRRMCKSQSAELHGSATCEVGFFADTKYDGERLIGFRTDLSEPFAFYSRNMLPVPARKLSGVAELLVAAFGPTARVVFDAEILSLSTFGSMNEVHKGDIAMSGPRVFVFDLLWYNGHSLTALSLIRRKEILFHVLTPSRNVQLSKTYWLSATAGEGRGTLDAEAANTSSAANKIMERQLMMVFEDAMAKRLEGFVLKPGGSSYRFNGTDWVKLKKGYMIGDDKPGTAGAQLPGGLVTAMRIRRIDGVPVTALTLAATATAEGKFVASPSSMATTDSSPTATKVGGKHGLFCKLNDGIDCLVVGRCTAGERRNTVLCALQDDDGGNAAQGGRFVTCGFARCPPELEDAVFRRAAAGNSHPPSWVVLPTGVPGTPSSWLWFGNAEECPVVEIRAAGLVSDPQQTCDGVAVTPDAHIVCLREDKSIKCVNTRSQLRVMFSFAMPVLPQQNCGGVVLAAARDGTPLRAAVRTFNEQHWVPLPRATDDATVRDVRGEEPIFVVEVDRHGTTAVNAVLKDSVNESLTAPMLHVLLVFVAPGKRWSERGVMGEVTTKLGPLVGQASDATLARPTTCSGDLAAVLLPERPNVVCVVAALIRFASAMGSPGPTLAPTLETGAVLDVVLVRLLGMVCSVANGYGGGIRIHADVVRDEDIARCSATLSKFIQGLPSQYRDKLSFVIHAR